MITEYRVDCNNFRLKIATILFQLNQNQMRFSCKLTNRKLFFSRFLFVAFCIWTIKNKDDICTHTHTHNIEKKLFEGNLNTSNVSCSVVIVPSVILAKESLKACM